MLNNEWVRIDNQMANDRHSAIFYLLCSIGFYTLLATKSFFYVNNNFA